MEVWGGDMGFLLNLVAFFSVLGVVGGALSAYLQVLDPGYSYLAFAIGTVLSLVFLFLVIILTIFGNLGTVRFYFFASFTLLWACVSSFFGFYVYKEQVSGRPYLNDISTDLNNPPTFQYEPLKISLPIFLNVNFGHIKSAKYDMSKAGFQRDRYTRIKQLSYDLGPEEVHDIAKSVAKGFGWRIVKQGDFRFEAVAISKVLHLPDDVVVEVVGQASGGGSVLRIRSRSRFGIFDFGVNANRILDYAKKVRELVIQEIRTRENF